MLKPQSYECGRSKRCEEILLRIQKINGYVSGLDEFDFVENELIRDACHANLIVISEAMARMSEEVKQEYSDLKWKEIIGFRNLIIHEYFRINWKTVWEVVTNDLKELDEKIQHIINSAE